MANFAERYAQNVPGAYYITEQCTDCDLCRECAPHNIRRYDAGGHAYVFRQPSTPEEVAACEMGVEGCPTQAVGNDGLRHSWAGPLAREQEREQDRICHAGRTTVYPEKLFPFLTVSRDLPGLVSRVLRRVLGHGPRV